MDTAVPEVKVERPDRVIERHLVGLGVLVVTLTTGYMLTGLSGVRQASSAPQQEVARVESAESDATPADATPAEDDIDTQAGMDAFIKKVAAKYNVSPDLVAAVIEAESEFNPRAVSRRGARGLMQLMPKTAKSLGVDDPFDPRENIEAGVRHLRALMDRFGDNLPLVLAAYNAGEVAVIKHRGVPPYRETRAYVKRIMKRLDRIRSA
jgi:soluble lytic murein transglycosylase-like protein